MVEDRRTIERAEPAGIDGYAGVLDGALRRRGRVPTLVLLAGARAPIRFEHTAPPLLPPGVPVVHLCEDARELDLGPPEAHALPGEARLVLRELARSTAPPRTARSAPAPCEAHRADVRRRDGRPTRGRHGAHPGRRADAPAVRGPGAGTWVVDDSVTSQSALLEHALAYDGGLRYLTTAGGSLGWAMGAALGVAEARPEEPVVAVVGDGVFQFGMPALWTAADRALPVVFVVVNNRAYGAVRPRCAGSTARRPRPAATRRRTSRARPRGDIARVRCRGVHRGAARELTARSRTRARAAVRRWWRR